MSPSRIRTAATTLGILGALQVATVASVEAQSRNRRTPNDAWSAGSLYYCRTDRDLQGKFYFSNVARSQDVLSDNDLQQSFAAFMVTKYGYPRNQAVSCGLADSQNESEVSKGRKGAIENLQKSNFTVIEVDFAYTPVANLPAPASAPQVARRPAVPASPSDPVAATPSVSPAPVAALKKVYGICSARAMTATYFSEPFEASGMRVQEWSKAFRAMLVDKYQYSGTGGLVCRGGATLEDVQKIAEQQRKTAPPARPIVDTAWKFQ